MQENIELLEFIPKSLKRNVKNNLNNIHKTNNTNAIEVLNDQISFLENITLTSTYSIY